MKSDLWVPNISENQLHSSKNPELAGRGVKIDPNVKSFWVALHIRGYLCSLEPDWDRVHLPNWFFEVKFMMRLASSFVCRIACPRHQSETPRKSGSNMRRIKENPLSLRWQSIGPIVLCFVWSFLMHASPPGVPCGPGSSILPFSIVSVNTETIHVPQKQQRRNRRQDEGVGLCQDLV